LFPRERLFENLVWIGAAFSISVVLSTLSLVTTIAPSGVANTLLMTAVVWLKLILVLLPPYVLAGMAIAETLRARPGLQQRPVDREVITRQQPLDLVLRQQPSGTCSLLRRPAAGRGSW